MTNELIETMNAIDMDQLTDADLDDVAGGKGGLVKAAIMVGGAIIEWIVSEFV
jgi:hypothetical protein